MRSERGPYPWIALELLRDRSFDIEVAYTGLFGRPLFLDELQQSLDWGDEATAIRRGVAPELRMALHRPWCVRVLLEAEQRRLFGAERRERLRLRKAERREPERVELGEEDVETLEDFRDY